MCVCLERELPFPMFDCLGPLRFLGRATLMPEAPEFQNLCLTLDPMLQAECMFRTCRACWLSQFMDISGWTECLSLWLLLSHAFCAVCFQRPCFVKAEVDKVNAKRKRKVPELSRGLMRTGGVCRFYQRASYSLHVAVGILQLPSFPLNPVHASPVPIHDVD